MVCAFVVELQSFNDVLIELCYCFTHFFFFVETDSSWWNLSTYYKASSKTSWFTKRLTRRIIYSRSWLVLLLLLLIPWVFRMKLIVNDLLLLKLCKNIAVLSNTEFLVFLSLLHWRLHRRIADIFSNWLQSVLAILLWLQKPYLAIFVSFDLTWLLALLYCNNW